MPELIENLFITYTKQDRLGSSNGHRGRLSESPMPVRFDVRPVIDALSNEMTTWARVLVDAWGLDVPEPPRRSAHNGKRGVVFPASTPAVDLACYAAEWLADHVGYLRTHPAAMEAYNGLTGAIAGAEMAIDRPERTLYVGDCDFCPAPLYAPLKATAVKCERCGTRITGLAQRWDSAKLKLRGYPATAADIGSWVAELCEVPIGRKLVNSWHHRKPFRVIDIDRGHPRFRIGEVLDRAAKSKPRKAG